MNEENKTEEESKIPNPPVGQGIDLETAKQMEKMPFWVVVLGAIVIGAAVFAFVS